MIPETDLFASAFFLADHASVENGKIYVNGGFWNQMQFAAFPAAASFSVVGVINVPWRANMQNHKFRVLFNDADGHQLDGEFNGEFNVSPNALATAGEPFLMPIAAAANGFIIPAAGHYSAILLVDGTEVGRWGFRVTSTAPVEPARGGGSGGSGSGSGGSGSGPGPGDIPRF